jgi:hypothetical protein
LKKTLGEAASDGAASSSSKPPLEFGLQFLGTKSALRLDVPATLVAGADEVIE